MAKDVEVTWNDKLADSVVDALSDGEMMAGVLDGEYPDGKSVSEVAQYLEFGTVKNPPRPFLRETLDGRGGDWVSAYAEALRDGDSSGDAKAKVARKMSEDIKETIAARGLVDTGTLYNSITSTVD